MLDFLKSNTVEAVLVLSIIGNLLTMAIVQAFRRGILASKWVVSRASIGMLKRGLVAYEADLVAVEKSKTDPTGFTLDALHRLLVVMLVTFAGGIGTFLVWWKWGFAPQFYGVCGFMGFQALRCLVTMGVLADRIEKSWRFDNYASSVKKRIAAIKAELQSRAGSRQ